MDQATKPHPNAKILKAIADGVAVQWRYENLREEAQIWRDYSGTGSANPLFVSCGVEWRIKPQPRVSYTAMIRFDDGRVLTSAIISESLDSVCTRLKQSYEKHRYVGVLATTQDNGDITKVEYFTMKELRDKGWL